MHPTFNHSNHTRPRPPESKGQKGAVHRDYEDEQEAYQVRQGDSGELRELKGKLRMLVGKVATGKKEREQLQRENEGLQKQIMGLQNNLRHMVAGFANSSSNFPMANQLAAKIAEFYKCDCLDVFFDVLGPEELTLKGVIYFFMQAFAAASAMVDEHFQPGFAAIRSIGCLQNLQGPVLNVLRKAFQSKHEEILPMIAKQEKISRRMQQLVEELGLGSNDRQEAVEAVGVFFRKLVEVVLECRISDPPMVVEVGGIGKRVEFNALWHDPFDGFIKGKEECFVILPQVRKQETGDIITKALVLHKNYDPTN